MLGEIEVRRFISLMAMADLGTEKPDELIRASIIRARLCELLGRESHSDMDESELFTLGLFSLIDAIFDQDMESIMERLPLSEAIKRALLEGKGELADYLNLASSYEKGDWSAVSGLVTKIGVAEEKMAQCYMDAVGWADSMGTI